MSESRDAFKLPDSVQGHRCELVAEIQFCGCCRDFPWGARAAVKAGITCPSTYRNIGSRKQNAETVRRYGDR